MAVGLANMNVTRRLATAWACGLLWLYAAYPAQAALAAAQVQIVAEVREAGEPPRLRPLARVSVQQGQEIFYTVRIRNPQTTAMAALSVVQPVPVNTRYVAGSATGAGADITFSTDGGRTFAKPAELRSVDNSDPIPSQSYTHIRWQLRFPLAPGAVVLARFRAVFQ